MPKIFHGRFTVDTDQPFVVFMAGMRINRFWAFKEWFPPVRSGWPILRTLKNHTSTGCLGIELLFCWRGIVFLSYWRTFEELHQWAQSKIDPHLPIWQFYNKKVASRGDVGIWHETYLVEPGQYKVLYHNMPLFGLGTASRADRSIKHAPVVAKHEAARRRLLSKKHEPERQLEPEQQLEPINHP